MPKYERRVAIVCTAFSLDPHQDKEKEQKDGLILSALLPPQGETGAPDLMIDRDGARQLNALYILHNDKVAEQAREVRRILSEDVRDFTVTLKEIPACSQAHEFRLLANMIEQVIDREHSQNLSTRFDVLLNGLPNQSLGLVSAFRSRGEVERVYFYLYSSTRPIDPRSILPLPFNRSSSSISSMTEQDEGYRALSMLLSFLSEHSEWSDFMQTARLCVLTGTPLLLSGAGAGSDHLLWRDWLHEQLLTSRGAPLTELKDTSSSEELITLLESTQVNIQPGEACPPRLIFFTPHPEDMSEEVWRALNQALDQHESKPDPKPSIVISSAEPSAQLTSAFKMTTPSIDRDQGHLASFVWRTLLRHELLKISDPDAQRRARALKKWLYYCHLTHKYHPENWIRGRAHTVSSLMNFTACYIQAMVEWIQTNPSSIEALDAEKRPKLEVVEGHVLSLIDALYPLCEERV